MRPIVSATVVVALAASAAVAASYSGQQTREIKALSAEEVADLEAGRGMGLAKAAELNHYPGPAHVLELKDKLGLSPEQIAVVEASFQRMSAAAKPLGAELIARERGLDRLFASGAITPAALHRETSAIADMQGRLRAVHLAAHLEMREVLTPEQIALYDSLRGYGAPAPSGTPAQHRHQHGGG